MLNHHYRHLGLKITSDSKLLFLEEGNHCSSGAQIIILNKENLKSKRKNNTSTWVFTANHKKIEIYKKGICFIEIINGREIHYKKLGKFNNIDFSKFIANLVFGYLLFQRKEIVLHASCVSKNGKAILFCGPSGSGKSTLAAQLLSKFSFMSEDLSYLIKKKNQIYVSSSIPFIKLDPKISSFIECQNKYILQSDQYKRDFCEVSSHHSKNTAEVNKIIFLKWGTKDKFYKPSIKEALILFINNTFKKIPYSPSSEHSIKIFHFFKKLNESSELYVLMRKKEEKIANGNDFFDTMI